MLAGDLRAQPRSGARFYAGNVSPLVRHLTICRIAAAFGRVDPARPPWRLDAGERQQVVSRLQAWIERAGLLRFARKDGRQTNSLMQHAIDYIPYEGIRVASDDNCTGPSCYGRWESGRRTRQRKVPCAGTARAVPLLKKLERSPRHEVSKCSN
jgi:hypothetical protein